MQILLHDLVGYYSGSYDSPMNPSPSPFISQSHFDEFSEQCNGSPTKRGEVTVNKTLLGYPTGIVYRVLQPLLVGVGSVHLSISAIERSCQCSQAEEARVRLKAIESIVQTTRGRPARPKVIVHEEGNVPSLKQSWKWNTACSLRKTVFLFGAMFHFHVCWMEGRLLINQTPYGGWSLHPKWALIHPGARQVVFLPPGVTLAVLPRIPPDARWTDLKKGFIFQEPSKHL